MKKNNLDDLRKEIDKIDDEIIELLAKRLEVVAKVAKYKITNNIPFLDLKRKQQLIEDKINKAQKNNVPENLVRKIYEIIHDESLKLEEKIK